MGSNHNVVEKSKQTLIERETRNKQLHIEKKKKIYMIHHKELRLWRTVKGRFHCALRYYKGVAKDLRNTRTSPSMFTME